MPQENKWLRTGFQVGGVKSVDCGAHSLIGASVIRPGEALGHGVWIDSEFCASVVAMAAQGKLATAGIKARFGHPNMCSDAMGTFLGRWKGLSIDESGKVSGDLHLSSTASESPKGDLRKYVEEMAAKEPDHFGASIVFTSDIEGMIDHAKKNGAIEAEDGEIDFSAFISPDPTNVKNLPHARCAELHAIDLVDDPAATDGMFSGAAGLSLAGQVTEWLDTHPEVFTALSQDNGMLDIFSRYNKELKPFIERYAKNMKEEVKLEQETTVTAEPVVVVDLVIETPAEPVVEKAEEDKSAASAEIAALSGTVAGLKSRIEAFQKEKDEAVKLAEEKAKAMELERNEAIGKLAAIEAGAKPLSSSHTVEKTKTTCLFKTGK